MYKFYPPFFDEFEQQQSLKNNFVRFVNRARVFMKGPDPYFFTEQIQDSVRILVRVETDPLFVIPQH